jgi:Skp family chaperone for outer membrane proteins
MRKSSLLLLAPGLLVFACWALGRLSAREAPAPAFGYSRIALLDLAKIYKELPALKEQMEAIKSAVSDEEKSVKDQAALIAASEEKLKNTTEGTTEYDDLQKSIAKSKTELAENVNGRRAYFYQREAEIYAAVYRDVEQETAAYAREKQIALVLRFSGDEMKTDDPRSVMTFINRPVIWHDTQLDITPEILKRLKTKPKKKE